MAMMPKPRTRPLRYNEDGEMAVQDNAFGFNHVVRGYSPEEVNDYIHNLSDSYRNTQTVLNKQREEYETEKEMLVCEINEMRDSRDQYKQQAEEMQATIEELREEILAIASGDAVDGSSSEELAKVMEENARLLAEVQASRNESEQLKKDIQTVTAEKEKILEMQSESGVDAAVVAEYEAKIEALSSDKEALEKRLEDTKNQLATTGADEELEVLRMENNDLVEKNRNLSIEMAKAQKKSRLAKEEAEKASSVKAELESNIEKLNAEKEALNGDIARIASEKEAIQRSIEEITSEKNDLADSIAQIASEKEQLSNSVEQLKAERTKVEEELEIVRLEKDEINRKAQSIKDALAGIINEL